MLAVRSALESSTPFSPWQLDKGEEDAGTAVNQQTLSINLAKPALNMSPTSYVRQSLAPQASTVHEASPVPQPRVERSDEGKEYIATSKEMSWLSQDCQVLGQFQQTYILVEMGRELWLVDQHVAHERVLYERFQKQLAGSSIQAQAFLVPQHLELGVTATAGVGEWAPRLAALGFEVEEFGSKDCLVRTVPAELSGIDPAELRELLMGIVEKGPMSDYRESALVLMSCRGAVKAGQSLAIPVMEQLMLDLFATDNPFTCPHGRPIVVRLALKDIHRRFGRL